MLIANPSSVRRPHDDELKSVDSLMAGLACGEASLLVWRFLEPAVDYFMTVSDESAAEAMRRFALGEAGDVPIVSGESGAAGLAALSALVGDSDSARKVGLDRRSRVLLINTEGATAPLLYASLTGLVAAEVQDAQSRWLESVDGTNRWVQQALGRTLHLPLHTNAAQ